MPETDVVDVDDDGDSLADEIGLYRRDVLQYAGAAGAALALGGASSGTATAQLTPIGYWGNPSGVPVLLSGAESLLTNNTAHGEALWDQIYATAVEMEYRRESALGSIENDAEMLAEYIRLDVANAIVEEAANDPGVSAVQDAALKVLEDEVAELERNLFNYWTIDFLGSMRRVNWFVEDDTGEIDPEGVFHYQYFSNAQDALATEDGEENDELLHATSTLVSGSHNTPNDWVDLHQELGVGDISDDNVEEFGQIDSTSTRAIIDKELANGDIVSVPVNLYITNDTQGVDPNAIAAYHPFAAPVSRFVSNNLQYDGHSNLEEADLEFGYPDGERGSTDMQANTINEWVSHSSDLFVDLDPEFHPWVTDSADTHDHSPVAAEHDLLISSRESNDDGTFDISALLEIAPFIDAHNSILEVLQQESANIQILVDNLYDQAASGELSADEIASGQAMKDAAEEGDDWQAAAGYYRATGAAEAYDPVIIESDGIEARGMLFRSRSNADSDPFPIGEEIDPSNVPGEIYGALEVVYVPPSDEDDPLLDDSPVSEGDILTQRLMSPFTIIEGPGDQLEFEERGLFEPDDNPEDIAQTLIELYDKELETREGSTEVSYEVSVPGGGGDGSFWDWLLSLIPGGSYGVLAGVGAVVLIVINIVTDLIPGLGD